jgi:hypothetical protein
MRELKIGDECLLIVGMPGPDTTNAFIYEVNDDGTYNVKAQLWGEDKWYQEENVPRRRLLTYRNK